MIKRFSLEVTGIDIEDAEEQLSVAQSKVFDLVRQEAPEADFECVHEYIGPSDRRGRPIDGVYGRRTFTIHPDGFEVHSAVRIVMDDESMRRNVR